MKLKELFTATEGIFSTFNNLFPTEYSLFFGEIETSDLDTYVLGSFGNKTLAPIIENNSTNYKVPLKVIFNIHMASWKKAYNALTYEYDFVNNYTVVETRTGTETTDTTNNDTNTDSVKGFDATDFSDSNKTVSDGTGQNKLTLDTQYTKKGNIGNTPISDLILKELEESKIAFYDIIIHNIINDITLSIYESED